MRAEMENLATFGALSITTRDLSKNPSKALRDACARPLIVMRHQRPVACLVSIEQWAELIGKLKDIEMNTSIAQVDLQIHSCEMGRAVHLLSESHLVMADAMGAK